MRTTLRQIFPGTSFIPRFYIVHVLLIPHAVRADLVPAVERTLVLATAASMVGLVFIIAGLIWLAVRRRAATSPRTTRT